MDTLQTIKGRIDKWFLEHENCTVEEFLETYSLNTLDEAKFIEFPKSLTSDIRMFSIVGGKFPKPFRKFLEERGVWDAFLSEMCSDERGKVLADHLNEAYASDDNVLYGDAPIYLSYLFGKKPESVKEVWRPIHREWIELVTKMDLK